MSRGASRSGIKQPVTQVLFTNVVYVRMKVKGKRYEIVCYPNKVNEWRNGVETDLDEVLQVPTVFTNASRGISASARQLQRAFQTDDHEVACEHILLNGEVQISKQERKVALSKSFKEVASIIMSKCINTETMKPFPQIIIEKAMKDIHFSVIPNKSSKAMALQLIPQLQEVLPIQRAQMQVRLVFPDKQRAKQAKTEIQNTVSQILKEEFVGFYVYEVVIDPGDFRAVDDIVGKYTSGRGSVQTVDTYFSATNETEEQN